LFLWAKKQKQKGWSSEFFGKGSFWSIDSAKKIQRPGSREKIDFWEWKSRLKMIVLARCNMFGNRKTYLKWKKGGFSGRTVFFARKLESRQIFVEKKWFETISAWNSWRCEAAPPTRRLFLSFWRRHQQDVFFFLFGREFQLLDEPPQKSDFYLSLFCLNSLVIFIFFRKGIGQTTSVPMFSVILWKTKQEMK